MRDLDTMERRKSGLNLPMGMSQATLRLETTPTTPPSRSMSNVVASPRSISSLTTSTSSPRGSKSICSDRFIPLRSSSRLHAFDLPSPSQSQSPSKSNSVSGASEVYARLLKQELFGSDFVSSSPAGGGGSSPNILRFKTEHSPAPGSPFSPAFEFVSRDSPSPLKPPRKFPKTPHKVLDAPALQDDFYLNLVDWSSQNMLAVGLGSCVYLWSASNSKVTKLCDLGANDTVAAVQWTKEGSYISIGTNQGKVEVYDASECKKTRSMSGHDSRAGVLAWNSRILSSGSRDRTILNRDLRVPTDFVTRLTGGHKSEVCGLKWSPDDRELASGGNDNQLLVWKQEWSRRPALRLTEHTAAVKAIAWSPHQSGLVASGGGTADRCIRFWSTAGSGAQVNCVDSGSQVCSLAWSKNVNEIVSTHGYSQNQIMVWKYPSLTKLATLSGHTLRVLYLAVSPDGQTIVTGAGDETLRFWNIFPSAPNTNGSTVGQTGLCSLGRTFIR